MRKSLFAEKYRAAAPTVNRAFAPLFFAGQLKTEPLSEVSSGGAFWAFVLAVLDNGGVVYGAVQENVDQSGE